MNLGKFSHGRGLSKPLFSMSFLKNCRDFYCYMFPDCTTKDKTLPINETNRTFLNRLGELMAKNELSMPKQESKIPAGYTYFGQFVDHDITFEPFSDINSDKFLDPQETQNFRTPCLDLDNLYGGGPAVTPFLYDHGPFGMGMKFLIGTNRNVGSGGPRNRDRSTGIPSDFDVPRTPDKTAIIGDPRNDENLFVSQLHHAFLKFHNNVLEHEQSKDPNRDRGTLFNTTRMSVTHHYQWIVVHDFLKRIIPTKVWKDVFEKENLLFFKRNSKNSNPFRLPVEFTVAAYRFGHSMVRDAYDFNDNFNDTVGNNDFLKAFIFISRDNLPVFSNWVVDFNRFFDTGINNGKVNKAMKIDTNMGINLSRLPADINRRPPTGTVDFMSILAARNLRRGLVFKLPSGQCVAKKCKEKPMGSLRELIGPKMQLSINGRIPAEMLTKELKDLRLSNKQLPKGFARPNKAFFDKDLLSILNKNILAFITKTPLWFYVLREAESVGKGEQLGPCGGRIVAETFYRMLQEDSQSIFNQPFTPNLPRIGAKPSGDFDMADLLNFAGVLTLN